MVRCMACTVRKKQSYCSEALTFFHMEMGEKGH